MSILTDGTHENLVLAQNVNGRLRAEARMAFARAFLWRASGAGIFLALAGIGVGAASYGYAYMNQFDSAAEKIASAMQAALSEVTLKTKGEVTLTDTVLKLEPPPAAAASPLAAVQAAAAAKQPEGSAPVRTTYTVFKSTPYLTGDIVTGWNFEGTGTNPTKQFCYFASPMSLFSTDIKQVNIAIDRKLVETTSREYNLAELVKKCVWYDKKLDN
ncbi:hypothetical protein ASG52_05865 [Methylobacterium sp. Leaf456]|uniref:hypothetical protein n=1 Tax=Methylobacterium sp. Leaf456 TaxID=1736382 RepID=UPI0006FB3E6F|nr:hypothetical protein [Methylobacterium sp. Leaf456]KQT50349.1 hypothetical protein ASG52_05865 [Methylobacterium sp. Leaf456]